MKKIFCASVFSVLLSFSGYAQEDADTRVGDLINRSDWFGLEEVYPQVKDSMQHAFLKIMAEAMICTNFNRPWEAIDYIDQLLVEYQAEMGFNNAANLVYMRALINGWEGYYGEAAHSLKDFLDQLKNQGVHDGFDQFKSLYAYYEPLRTYEPPALVRPDKETEIPLTIENTERGVLMFIPVSIRGKEYKFIFDTGSATTFMSERFATEVGVKILCDSLLIDDGMGGVNFGMKGYLDSLLVGDMTFKNIMVAVARANPDVDTVYPIDAVLGMDFMKLAKELRIYPGEKRIVFPVQRSPLPATGRNILLATGNQLRLKAYSGDGNPVADMIQRFSRVTLNLEEMFLDVK